MMDLMMFPVILLFIADGESLRKVCDRPGMPNKATVFRWLAQHAEFRDQYAKTPKFGGIWGLSWFHAADGYQAWTVFWAASSPCCTRISVASAAC